MRALTLFELIILVAARGGVCGGGFFEYRTMVYWKVRRLEVEVGAML